MASYAVVRTHASAGESASMEGMIKEAGLFRNDNRDITSSCDLSSTPFALNPLRDISCTQSTSACTDSAMLRTKWVPTFASEFDDSEETAADYLDTSSGSCLNSLTSSISYPYASTSTSIPVLDHTSVTPPLEATLELGQTEQPKSKSRTKSRKKSSTSSRSSKAPRTHKPKPLEPVYRPLGPRHLEYDYNLAHKHFKEVMYLALGSIGHHAKGKGKARADLAPGETNNHLGYTTAEIMLKMKSLPAVQRASARLDMADQRLEEAIANGELWENTELPEEMKWENMNFHSDFVDEEEEWVREPLVWADAERPVVKRPNTRASGRSSSGDVEGQKNEDVRLTRSQTGNLRPKVRLGEEPETQKLASQSNNSASPSRERKRKVDMIDDAENPQMIGGADEEKMFVLSPAKSTPSPTRKRNLDAVDKENEIDIEGEDNKCKDTRSLVKASSGTPTKRRRVLAVSAHV